LLIVNDPYQGGTHLPDITVVAAVFLDTQLLGFVANRAHHADIGADAPGSMPVSTCLEQEGLLIPPTLLGRGGVVDEAVLGGLLAQLRDGESARGDFSAQLGSCKLGVARLQALAGEMGLSAFQQRGQQLQDYAERLAAAALAEIPRGTYRFSDYMDDDGLPGGAPGRQAEVPICVAVTVRNQGVEVDFAGTAQQVAGNLNCPMAVTAAAVFYVFRCLMPPQVPACAGAMRSYRLSAPEGCLLNARAPAAVAAGNVETSMRVVDALCGALAQALPDRIPAASQGTMNNLAMGRAGADGWDYYETLAGGHGAGPGWHGLSARHSHMTNTLNTPVEVLERQYPLRVLRYTRRRGSGGAGQFSGGDGIVREYQFLQPARLSIISERRSRAPWGLGTGAAGSSGENLLDGQPLGGKCEREVAAGQVLTVKTPGGGGFGPG
jgi:N-methylhydantoinase B